MAALKKSLVLLVLIACNAWAGQTYYTFSRVSDTAHLAWDQNAEDNIALYRVYALIGNAPVLMTAVPYPQTEATATVHLDNYFKRFSFYVTAVNTADQESAPSDTITTIFCQESKLLADINSDGAVDVQDLATMDRNLGADPVEWLERLDLNADGVIDVEDRAILTIRLGEQ